MPKVSVVVPVYGVEKYIERCARSLFEQTLDDIEFIFIDDCSPDRSIEILNRIIEEYRVRFADMNYVVRIEHMPTNSGQAAVRKHGIQLCTGDYIIHCDSDDWVESDMYKTMYDEAVRESADVVVCDFVRTNAHDYTKLEIGLHSVKKQEYLLNCLFQKDHWSLCNKLFKRVIYYNNILYPSGAMGEDMVLCIQLLNQCEKITYVHRTLYNYYINPTSITKKTTINNCLKNFCALKINTDFIINYIEKDLLFDDKIKKQAIDYLRFINILPLLKIRHIPLYKSLWKDNFIIMPLSFFVNRRISLYNKLLYCMSLFTFYPCKKSRAIN